MRPTQRVGGLYLKVTNSTAPLPINNNNNNNNNNQVDLCRFGNQEKVFTRISCFARYVFFFISVRKNATSNSLKCKIPVFQCKKSSQRSQN